MILQPGLIGEFLATVQDDDTARASAGDRFPPVLSTPRVIGWMEKAAAQAVEPVLEPGQATVGALVNIRHLAATPVGMKVIIRAELREVDGRRLRFHIEAKDEVEIVAEGEHERFIINLARFIERVNQKQAKS